MDYSRCDRGYLLSNSNDRRLKKDMDKQRLIVKKHGDIVELRLYGCYGNRDEYFKGQARINNDEELKALFDAAIAKGFRLPKSPGWW